MLMQCSRKDTLLLYLRRNQTTKEDDSRDQSNTGQVELFQSLRRLFSKNKTKIKKTRFTLNNNKDVSFVSKVTNHVREERNGRRDLRHLRCL